MPVGDRWEPRGKPRRGSRLFSQPGRPERRPIERAPPAIHFRHSGPGRDAGGFYMRKHALLTTVFAGALMAGGAFAADPAPSGDIEAITVTGVKGTDAGGGLISEQDAPKQRSAVSTDFIATQAPTENPVQLLRLLPGVNVGSQDAFGIQNSTITV